MGQLGGEDIAQAPHVNGQLEKSKTTPARPCLCPREPQLDKVLVTDAVVLCLTMQHKMRNLGFSLSISHKSETTSL